jgi:nitroimidazol reductase NimA-like FMN-containing flavoprotein (pyridoxamine 5'-phosphate oxidase superfamily)
VDAVGVMPSVVPVNYLLDNDRIVIRTDAGSKLAAALRGASVAFEVAAWTKPDWWG